jgi:ATP-dependent protease ClpP protease subunit
MVFSTIIFLIHLLGTFGIFGEYNTIELNNYNNIILKDVITKESVSNVVYEINKVYNKSSLYLILDTVGGEVEHGMKIINEIKKYNISCVAIRAYSMGFAILQACKKRYVLPDTTVMQHQISFGIQGEFEKIKSHMVLTQQYENYLVQLQMNRIRLSYFDFTSKIDNEWWIFGENIIFENVADEIVYVSCTPQLTTDNYTITLYNHDITYSSCPLISKELQKKRVTASSHGYEFI